MALITCKECKKQISDQATKCPACGAPNKSLAEKRRELFLAPIMLPFGAFLLYIFFHTLSQIIHSLFE